MSRIPQLKRNRNENIRKEYAVLAAKMVGTKQLYRHDAILEMLSTKFYLAQATIERIVSGAD